MNSSPLQHFLFQEIFLGLSHPLFSSQKDFMELAVTVRGISWYGKKPENLKPIMSTQMKKRGEPGAVQIVRHHGLYKAVVKERLNSLLVTKATKEATLLMFETAFKNHLDEKSTVMIDFSSTLVTAYELNCVLTCMKGNGGKATIGQIIQWVHNIQNAGK